MTLFPTVGNKRDVKMDEKVERVWLRKALVRQQKTTLMTPSAQPCFWNFGFVLKGGTKPRGRRPVLGV